EQPRDEQLRLIGLPRAGSESAHELVAASRRGCRASCRSSVSAAPSPLNTTLSEARWSLSLFDADGCLRRVRIRSRPSLEALSLVAVCRGLRRRRSGRRRYPL